MSGCSAKGSKSCYPWWYIFKFAAPLMRKIVTFNSNIFGGPFLGGPFWGTLVWENLFGGPFGRELLVGPFWGTFLGDLLGDLFREPFRGTFLGDLFGNLFGNLFGRELFRGTFRGTYLGGTFSGNQLGDFFPQFPMISYVPDPLSIKKCTCKSNKKQNTLHTYMVRYLNTLLAHKALFSMHDEQNVTHCTK